MATESLMKHYNILLLLLVFWTGVEAKDRHWVPEKLNLRNYKNCIVLTNGDEKTAIAFIKGGDGKIHCRLVARHTQPVVLDFGRKLSALSLCGKSDSALWGDGDASALWKRYSRPGPRYWKVFTGDHPSGIHKNERAMCDLLLRKAASINGTKASIRENGNRAFLLSKRDGVTKISGAVIWKKTRELAHWQAVNEKLVTHVFSDPSKEKRVFQILSGILRNNEQVISIHWWGGDDFDCVLNDEDKFRYSVIKGGVEKTSSHFLNLAETNQRIRKLNRKSKLDKAKHLDKEQFQWLVEMSAFPYTMIQAGLTSRNLVQHPRVYLTP